MAALSRLVNKREAAHYCGMSLGSFTKYVEIDMVPVRFSGRCVRYDIKQIDAIIDKAVGDSGEDSKAQWLERVNSL